MHHSYSQKPSQLLYQDLHIVLLLVIHNYQHENEELNGGDTKREYKGFFETTSPFQMGDLGFMLPLPTTNFKSWIDNGMENVCFFFQK